MKLDGTKMVTDYTERRDIEMKTEEIENIEEMIIDLTEIHVIHTTEWDIEGQMRIETLNLGGTTTEETTENIEEEDDIVLLIDDTISTMTDIQNLDMIEIIGLILVTIIDIQKTIENLKIADIVVDREMKMIQKEIVNKKEAGLMITHMKMKLRHKL